MKYLKIVVASVLATALLFTAVVLAFSLWERAVPDALIISFFSFIGVELTACATIRVSEVKNAKESESSSEDNLEREEGDDS